MQVRPATAKDKEAWDTYVDSRPDAAPYCRFAWKDAVEQAYGHKPCYLLAEEAGQIKGILPLLVFRIPFYGSSLVSLPFCDVGDVIADNSDTKQALLAETMGLAEKLKAKEVIVRSCQENLIGEKHGEWHVSVQAEKVRMILSLPGSSEELWKSFKSKLRSQIRKAKKNGLIFRWGNIQDLSSFYEVFSQNMHDLGSPVHSKKWIKQIIVNYENNARMGLVFKADQPVGCGIILFTEHIVSIPWASTLREFNKLSPNMMLYWNFLKFAADSGRMVFDFGRSTPGEGTYRFKKQWGAEPEQLYWYKISKSPVAIGKKDGFRRQQVERLWVKLPVPVVNALGPKIRKYISL